ARRRLPAQAAGPGPVQSLPGAPAAPHPPAAGRHGAPAVGGPAAHAAPGPAGHTVSDAAAYQAAGPPVLRARGPGAVPGGNRQLRRRPRAGRIASAAFHLEPAGAAAERGLVPAHPPLPDWFGGVVHRRRQNGQSAPVEGHSVPAQLSKSSCLYYDLYMPVATILPSSASQAAIPRQWKPPGEPLLTITSPSPAFLAGEDREAALVAQLVARDERALRVLYDRYANNLLTVILRVVHDKALAQDVLQEGLLKVWLSIASYDASRGRLFTWMVRVCCNQAIDAVRSPRHRFNSAAQSLDITGVQR
nr:hypothetical protein [Tanacetum cinerariifolium]